MKKLIVLLSFIVLFTVSCAKKDMPIELGEVQSVAFDTITIEDKKTIGVFLELVSSAKYETESINDFPVGVEDYKTVKIQSGDVLNTLYLYKQKGVYYAEIPYEGVWTIEKKKYEAFDKALEVK